MVSNKVWALICSVAHHGLGNLTDRSKPARTETVVITATSFEKYLNGN